jgi:hypothetical protein
MISPLREKSSLVRSCFRANGGQLEAPVNAAILRSQARVTIKELRILGIHS